MPTTHSRPVCSSNLFASLSRQEAFARIAGLGFEYVDLWASPLIADHADLPAGDPAAVRKDLDDAGLTVTSMTAFLLDDAERARLNGFAEAVGAESIVIEPGPSSDWPIIMTNLPAEGRLIGHPGQSLDEFLAIVDPMASDAGARGLRYLLEAPHVATVVHDRGSIDRFLADPRSERFGLTFAPPHLAITEADLVEAVTHYRDHISMFYIWNVKPGYRGSIDGRAYGTGEQQLSPHGELDVRGAAQALFDSGIPLDYVIAAHGTEANADGDAVEQMVRASMRQLPQPLQDQLAARRA